MRIGFVTCHFPPDSIGGGQMQSMRLCEALGEKHEVTVFTRSYNSDLAGKERTGSYFLQRRKVLKLPIIRSIVDLVKVLLQIRSHKNDTKVYISFHIQLASLMVVLAKLLFGTKAVISPRGHEDFDFKWYKKGLQKFIYANTDLILIQSERIKEAFISSMTPHFAVRKQERIKKKIKIFPNGITVNATTPKKLSERANQIVFIGRLEPIKGVVHLIEAFRHCDQSLHLVIIGDGSQRRQIELCSKGLNISILGKCTETEINVHLQNSKVLLLPSLSENFPNVILEAFRAGVPVIGSNVGAVPELIEDGINGYLVPPSVPSILAEKISLLVQSEKLDEMGKKSYQKVADYDWRHLVNKFDSIIGAN